MEQKTLGRTGPAVAAIGLGCMGMSELYGATNDQESLATLNAALDRGVTLLDSGDFYGMGHNEMLIREALRGRRREEAVLSVKFGILRGPDGGWYGVDTRPAAIRNSLAYSLKRLGTDYIDIYRPARLDPNVPIEDTIGELANLVKAGWIRHIGLSEVGVETLRRAAAVHPIADLQIEYSLLSRGIEASILPACRELGIGVTAYGVLGRGLISGHFGESGDLAANDFRRSVPRFADGNRERNLALVEALRRIAAEKQVSVAQLAIAWAGRNAAVVPLVGARTRVRLDESLAAAGLVLNETDIARLDALFPPGAAAGERYHPSQMAHLDSERH